jgi:hypothetical protein
VLDEFHIDGSTLQSGDPVEALKGGRKFVQRRGDRGGARRPNDLGGDPNAVPVADDREGVAASGESADHLKVPPGGVAHRLHLLDAGSAQATAVFVQVWAWLVKPSKVAECRRERELRR